MKWLWRGLGCAVVVVCVWWMVKHRGEPSSGDRAGSGQDEHAKMCALKHKPFIRHDMRKWQLPRKDSRPPTYSTPRDSSPHAAVPRTAVPTAAKAVQPLLDVVESAPLPPPPGSDDAPDGNFTGDCPSSICGDNGVWLGNGVAFRTLHLSPYRHNEANLSLLAFRGPSPTPGVPGTALTLAIDGDRLHPAGAPLQNGSVLVLGPAQTPDSLEPSTPTYEITITGVEDKPFLVDCANCARPTYRKYLFSARSLSDDCPLEVCDPDLDDGTDEVHNLIGSAVIFQGDFYEPGHTVGIAPPTSYDDDTFNIACLGTAMSKLHVLRHTTASGGAVSDPLPPPVDKRQTLLRMLTADYCGSGQPFTHNGVRLQFGIDLAAGFDGRLNPRALVNPSPDPNAGIQLASWSRFPLDPLGPLASIDALWNKDGATCIGTPRLVAEDPRRSAAIWSAIEANCRSVNHPVVRCDPDVPALQPPYGPHFPLTSYAISQIPTGP